jgi:hypothetical protein
MADVVKKHSIASELAQKMVDAAVAKARKLGVRENVAILDDGAISKPLAGWSPNPLHRDGAEQGVHRSVRRLHPGLLRLYPRRRVALGRHPHASARGGIPWGVPH